ncbi:MAG: hypothetical protein R3A79_07270 [Nannocystaceae bacterium]
MPRPQGARRPRRPRRGAAAALLGLAAAWLGCTGEGEPNDDAGEAPRRCLARVDLEAPTSATSEPTCGPDEAPQSPAHLATLDLLGLLAAFPQEPAGGQLDLDLGCEVAAIDQASAGAAAELTLRCLLDADANANTDTDEAIEVPLRLSAPAVRMALCEGDRLDLWVLVFDALLCGRSHAYGLTRAEDGALLIAATRGTVDLLQGRAAPLDVKLTPAGCEATADSCVETERGAIAAAVDGGPPGFVYEGTRRRVAGPPSFVVQADYATVRRVADPCDDCSSVDVVVIRDEPAAP